MKHSKPPRIPNRFPAKTTLQFEATLRAAHKNGLLPVFEALREILVQPSITHIHTEGVHPQHTTASGWVLPSGPNTWPLLVVEISGAGVSYIKTEKIRTHAVVVPLKLNTRTPSFAGAAMAATLLQTYGAYIKKTGYRPQRNLRFIFTSCDETLEAFLERPSVLGPQVFSAMELDLRMRGGKSTEPNLRIDSGDFGRKSFVTHALQELLGKVPLKKQTGTPHSLALPPYKTPFTRLSGTLPPNDETSITTIGRALLKSLKLLGDTDYEDGRRFMRSRFQRAATEMQSNSKKAKQIYTELLQTLRGFDQLMHRGPWWQCPRSTIVRHRKQGHLIDGRYYPRTAYQLWQTRELEKLKKHLPPTLRIKPTAITASPALMKRANALVPARTFHGRLGPEGFSNGLEPWMQQAASLASGKKTVVEIFQALEKKQAVVPIKPLLHFFEKLERLGRVVRRPIITAQQIRKALADSGIVRGDVVMVHAGYASYGYIDVGPKGLIDLLQDAVGPTGTICMPTHTLSLIGQLPYDPETSSAVTGLLPNLFLSCPDVLRSLHPTHSVAARGPQAEYLLERSIAKEPVFGKESFWGRLVKANGKILMLCDSLGPNTLLHGIDYWAGAALPDSIAHLIQNGEREEVKVQGIPFHDDSFAHIYKAMETKQIVKTVPLGTGTVYTMEAQKLKLHGVPVVRKNPLLATQPGCDCDYCAHLRRAEARRIKKQDR